MTTEDNVILVDERDNQIGEMEKLEAHQKGLLHRAFSIFVFNVKGELMLQQRAYGKYHSGGLWTNACCSHPRPGEEISPAAHRRLQEEMGFDCALNEIYTFVYNAALDNDLIEHEFDHVLIGTFDNVPKLNPEEAENWKWIAPTELRKNMATHPEHYTYWLLKCFDNVMRRV